MMNGRYEGLCRFWRSALGRVGPRSLIRDRSGAVTVEFVLWLPVLLGLILTAVDAGLLFSRQSTFWNVSQETARLVSRHALQPDAAEEFARAQVGFAGYTPDVSVRIDQAKVVITITGDSRQMAPFGMLRFVVGDRVTTHVAHVIEPI
jgi:Flp pilus assembly protein TadG